MKIFQVMNDLCHWQTPHKTLEETIGKYAPDIQFVEAPENVFEGWGYLDGAFIKPTPPNGWLYDDATGTFYQEGDAPPVPPIPPTLEDTESDLLGMAVDHEYRLTLLELGVNDNVV